MSGGLCQPIFGYMVLDRDSVAETRESGPVFAGQSTAKATARPSSGTTGWWLSWMARVVAGLLPPVGLLATATYGHGLLARSPPTQTDDTELPSLNGAPVVARFERRPAPLGGQILFGETRFQWGTGDATLVTEEARLDRDGRLLHVEIRLAKAGKGTRLPWEGVSLDARLGLRVQVTHGGQTVERRVPTDLPWAYIPVQTPGGGVAITPVSALVALRAAEGSEAVRVFDPYGESAPTTSDQILPSAAKSEAERSLVLGDDLATFRTNSADRDDLLRLRIAVLGADVTQTSRER